MNEEYTKVDWDDINKPSDEPWNMAPPVAKPKTMRKMGNVTMRQFPKVMRRTQIRAMIGDILISPGFLIAAGSVALLTLLMLAT